MKLSKEDKAMLREEYAKVWKRRDGSLDEKMIEHCVNSTSGYLEFDDMVFTMSKPHIQTDFWFGERTYDYDEVVQYCKECSEDERYFIEQNMGKTDAGHTLECIKEALDEFPTTSGWVVRQYQGKGENNLVHVLFDRDEPYQGAVRKLSDDELLQLREFCEAEQGKFYKRLQTYLKRYGLSKCHYSTYWMDR